MNCAFPSSLHMVSSLFLQKIDLQHTKTSTLELLLYLSVFIDQTSNGNLVCSNFKYVLIMCSETVEDFPFLTQRCMEHFCTCSHFFQITIKVFVYNGIKYNEMQYNAIKYNSAKWIPQVHFMQKQGLWRAMICPKYLSLLCNNCNYLFINHHDFILRFCKQAFEKLWVSIKCTLKPLQ